MVSGAGTYVYFVSILLSPLFIAMWLFLRHASRDQPPHPCVIFGRALSVAAVLMPVAAFAGFSAFTLIGDRLHPGVITAGAPAYWAIFTPPALVLAASLGIATVRSFRASSTELGGRGAAIPTANLEP